MRTALCSGCLLEETVDLSWRALWIDSDGDLVIAAPVKGGDLDFERPNTVFVCGQLCALRLTERYLHSGSFEQAHADALQLANAAREANDLFTELT